MRFSIRDVLWLTVVVGLGCAWWTARTHAVRLNNENFALKQSHEMMRQAIEILETDHDAVVRNLPRIEPIYADDDPAIKSRTLSE